MEISADEVRAAFDYDPETGQLSWRKRPLESFKNRSTGLRWNKCYAGKPAGYTGVTGSAGIKYTTITFAGRHWRAHLLAWIHFYGSKPSGVIDHIDGDGANNRIDNLRSVTPGENSRNARLYRKNTSGVCGVREHKPGYWRARIQKDGRRILLGHFKDFFEAVCARKSAELDMGFSERHGRK